MLLYFSRSLYSGVYKLDVEEEPYSCVKKIFPTTTIKPVILPSDKQASLCNFIDLSDNQQGRLCHGNFEMNYILISMTTAIHSNIML